MKKGVILSVVLLFLVSTYVDAQRWRTRRWETFFGAGTANLYGDIGGYYLTDQNWYGLKDFEVEFTRPSLVVGGKYKFNHRWYVRVNLAGALFQGDDIGTLNAVINTDPLHPGREGGFKYTSFIFEPSAMTEFYVIPESRSMVSQAIYNRKGMVNGFRMYNIYLFGGVGAGIYFPTVKYLETGEVLDVDSEYYQEEGASFHRVGLVLPVGIGVRTDLTSYWTIGAELGRRYTFTDYIDGYTSRFSSAADVYDFLNIVLSYKIRTDKNGWPVIFRKTGLN